MSQLHCIVVTPEAPVRDEPAEFVALTLWDGEIGIAPGHAPLIGRLGCGEMRIRYEGQVERYYVEGGFVEVLDNVVSVLTKRAVPAEQLEADVIQQQLRTAQARPAHSSELIEQRDRAVEQSRAQLRVARRAK
jgi:F-type H+-transporting ATPase subunit epsilon